MTKCKLEIEELKHSCYAYTFLSVAFLQASRALADIYWFCRRVLYSSALNILPWKFSVLLLPVRIAEKVSCQSTPWLSPISLFDISMHPGNIKTLWFAPPPITQHALKAAYTHTLTRRGKCRQIKWSHTAEKCGGIDECTIFPLSSFLPEETIFS